MARRGAPLLCAVLVLLGCAGCAPPSGAYGTVTAGPTCPVEQAAHPCPDRPARVHLEAVRFPAGFRGAPLPRSGRVVARFSSDGQGRFRVPLPPGRYVLYGDRAMTGYLYCQGSVTVPRRRYAPAAVHCDTGLA